MEEKNSKKIKLITIFLILFLIIFLIIFFIIGIFIYNLYKDKHEISDLNNKIVNLENTIDSKTSDLFYKTASLEYMVDNLNRDIESENSNVPEDDQEKDVDNNGVIKYELKTRESLGDIPNINKYFIDSEDELNNFYSIFSDELDLNKDYLNDNSVFIQVEKVSSGSIKVHLSSVTFDDNTVNFVVDKDYPQVGTADIGFWYLVAIIPNNKLNNLNLSDWSKPSEIIDN